MKRTLKTCQMTLTAFGPVFVGSGKEIPKKEYIFLRDNTVAVLDIEKLYARLSRRCLQQEYLKFLLSNNRKEDLKLWLRKHSVSLAEIQSCIRYRLEQQDTVNEREARLRIMECMKDPYGKPYIPGSSVKGMLRTILLCQDIIKNPSTYNREKDHMRQELFGARGWEQRKSKRREVLARSMADIETKRYYLLERKPEKTDAVNDMLSGLIISDSEPMERKDLILCQKIDCHTDGSERKLPLLRECLRPGTKITCSLTIDESICPITVQEIRDAVKRFTQIYETNFLQHFHGVRVDRLTSDMVFLGGGCGFASKTMIYAMFPDREGVRVSQAIFEKTGVPREHGHSGDLQKGVSPHTLKCTHYHEKLLQMGMCSCKIQEKN